MQCDECGKEVSGIQECPNAYGFRFCCPLDVPIEQECCEDKFERKLWEAAQASNEAKQKAASETNEASVSTPTMVEGVPRDWQAP